MKAIFIGFARCVLAFAACAWAISASAQNLLWAQLTLDDASGVPAAADHNYWFTGILGLPDMISVQGSPNANTKMWSSGSGTWDGSRKLAKEKMQLSGAWNGNLTSSYHCEKDPWIYAANCVRTDLKFSASGASNWTPNWERMLSQRPVSATGGWLATAAELSKRHVASTPPPPPPPAAKSPPVLRSFGVRAKPQVNAQVGAQAALKTALHPDLTVGGASVRIDTKCDRNQPVAHAHVVVRNVGTASFPYLQGIYTVSISEAAGKARVAGGVEVREIKAGQSIGVDVPLHYALAPSDLIGAHRITITLNALKFPVEKNLANNTYALAFSFPQGYCLPTKPGAGSISAGQAIRQSGQIRSLNPQPEPPKPKP